MVLDNLKDFNLGISPRVAEKITEFVNMIKSFSAMVPNYTAYQLGDYIYYTASIKRELEQDRTPEGFNRMENIQELLNGLKDFSEKPLEEGIIPTLSMFMEDVALLTNEDRNKEDEQNKDRVLLMTIHSAKGLEFNYVYIAGLEENLFPSQMALMSREELEEERRLFYVAVTRARKQVVLTYAISRYRYGSAQSNEPSRFLEEIPPECLNNLSYREDASEHIYSRTPTAFRKPAVAAPSPSIVGKKLMSMNKAAQTSLPMDNSHLSGLKVGAKVEHERFGQGEVLTVEGVYPNSKATVMFANGEKKQLLLKFAKLKIVG
jgi:DNA helicase-2/ATP-dependent DNA helicase PcrA